ncbi:helix-turn-helix domain-containing protein [Limnoglobus roseus]|uniref:Uncharacterized protein n=1 Tax=Limnoglobus roseus TaxID=2598579 RepID=A0A5C1A671_9BACT|nr:hypothetical protein [Limnoglobus roseus]QEL13865.1 hypothetical protein PX52LOC_00723 [Limnoglobus roseus]
MISAYILNMTGKKGAKPVLSIRQRLIYGRLAPLRRPVPAKRLSDMLGGLINRQTISIHLEKLATLGLVQKHANGWVAVEPPEDLRKAFSLLKNPPEGRGWHSLYASWKLPLPAKMPFPGHRNAVELYAAYWKIRGAEYHGTPWNNVWLGLMLGVTRQAVSHILMALRDEGLLTADYRCQKHNFELQTEEVVKEKKKSLTGGKGCALDIRVNSLAKAEDIHAVIDQLTAGNYMLRSQIYDIVGEALKEHKKNEKPGDGSALVLNWLNARLRTRHGIEDGAQQKLAESVAVSVAQDEARVRVEQEIAEKRKTRKSAAEQVAAFALPGENLRPSNLRSLRTVGELEAALPKLRPGMTTAEIMEITRPSKTPEPVTVAVPCFRGNALRDPEPVIMPTAEDDARFDFSGGTSFREEEDDIESLPDSFFAAA